MHLHHQGGEKNWGVNLPILRDFFGLREIWRVGAVNLAVQPVLVLRRATTKNRSSTFFE